MSNELDNRPSMDYYELRRRHEMYRNKSRANQPAAKPESPARNSVNAEADLRKAPQPEVAAPDPQETAVPSGQEARPDPVAEGAAQAPAQTSDSETPPVQIMGRGVAPEAVPPEQVDAPEDFPPDDDGNDYSDDEYDGEEYSDEEEAEGNPNPFQSFIEIFGEMKGFFAKHVGEKILAYRAKKNQEEPEEDAFADDVEDLQPESAAEEISRETSARLRTSG